MTFMKIERRQVVRGALAGLPLLALPGRRARAATVATTIANASGNINLVMGELLAQQGYLTQFGIDAKVINVADGSKILGGIVGGSVDSSMMAGFGQVFPAFAKGAQMKIIGGANLLPSLALCSAKPDIKSLKDLEGRTVGVGSLGALLHQLVVALLRKNHVDIKKIRFVNVGASGAVFKATTMGTVDAGTAEAAEIDHLGKYGVHLISGGNMSEGLTEYTYQGAWTSDRMIHDRRDVLVRTLAAYAKLYRFVHQPAAKDAFFKAWSTVFPHATGSEAADTWTYIQHYKPYAVNLALDATRIDYMQQLNVDLGIQAAVLPYAKVADMSLARDAIKLLG